MSARKYGALSVIIFCGAGLANYPAAADTIPSFQPLGYLLPTDRASLAYGIARDGSAVTGISHDGGQYNAFVWTPDDGMVDLGHLDPGYPVSAGFAVANGGVAAAGWSHVSQPLHAFRWTPEAGMVDLGDFPGGDISSRARGISADGSVVVGVGTPGYAGEPFRWTETGGMVGLGLLPGYHNGGASVVSADGSVVVGGCSDIHGNNQAFQWTSEGGVFGLGDLPGGYWSTRSEAYAVSGDGEYIVGFGESSNGFEAVRWSADGAILGLGDLPGGITYAFAHGVSADGSVVVGDGTLGDDFLDQDAFIWDEENGMRLLKDVLEDEYGLDLSGWKLSNARGVSDDGQSIVGWGIRPDGQKEAWLARIPEPTTLFLVMVGVAAVGSQRRSPAGAFENSHGREPVG